MPDGAVPGAGCHCRRAASPSEIPARRDRQTRRAGDPALYRENCPFVLSPVPGRLKDRYLAEDLVTAVRIGRAVGRRGLSHRGVTGEILPGLCGARGRGVAGRCRGSVFSRSCDALGGGLLPAARPRA